MKKFLFIAGILLVLIGSTFFSCKQRPPEKAIAETLLTQIDSFVVAKNNLLAAVQIGSANQAQLQALFLQTRIAYKKIEWATEYFSPAVSRFVNGPPVQEVETEAGTNQVFEPAGLQVIESYLFPRYAVDQKKELIRQLNLLQNGCDQYKSHFENIDILDWQVFDAAKLEVFRILSLGITGFDNPLTLKSMEESVAALQGMKTAVTYYTDEEGTENLMPKIDAAIRYLQDHSDYNRFDRAAFITQYGNDVTRSISHLEKKLNIHVIRYNRLLNQDAETLFDVNAFNVNAYAPAFITNKKIALGRVLFSDPVLSGTATPRSCQSCHQPEKAFTDGLVTNTIINTNQPLRRNTPTLLNTALQPSQFYDLRANTLEDQSDAVVQNKQEMHGSMKIAAKKLWGNKAYRQLFDMAFPVKDRTAIDTLEIMNAIGSYVRSLTALNSRFDEYMRGNKTAMNQQELSGFNLFMGKAKCATCHYMPLFNGTFPPRYMKIESEVIGVPQSDIINTLDKDMGRYDIVKIAAFKNAFKTMSVRNAARTAPYMHNGAFATLQQVLDFYNKGGGVGLGLKIDNQTLPFDKLNLTNKESSEIIAFIKCLDSK